jgi:hypothetical protein
VNGAASTGLRLPRGRSTSLVVAFALVAATLTAVAVSVWHSADDSAPPPEPREPAALPQEDLIRASGVRVVRVVVAGGGGLVDVRYQVLDTEKASTIHDTDRPPSVVDERSGTELDRQWMGHDATRHASKVGRTEYLLLLNPGAVVEAGSSVTVRLGDGSLEHVLVR